VNNPRKPHILVVDDEPNVRRVLATLLEQAGFAVTRAASGEQALQLVRSLDPDLVITDLKMPGIDGMELLRRLQQSFPEIPVVMLTAHGTVANAVEAMKCGALDFLTKPFEKQQVVDLVGKALAQASSARREYRGPLVSGARCGIVGDSPAIDRLRDAIEKIAPTPATVLIRGETGTGKELVAEALHQLSRRAQGPLVKINCGALPDHLVEAELFGFEKGAFTGADRTKPGRFELADGGTLFLDEVGELPIAMQVKLLRVLEDKRIDRVGGTASHEVDVRLITATHRDLEREVRSGGFREDLFYRLKVIELVVPPLRERPDDVARLVECFLDRHAERLDRPRPSIAQDTLATLSVQPWPGNVRELQNAVERAVLLADSLTLSPSDFGLGQAPSTDAREESSLKDAVRAAAAQTERRMILAALDLTGGNITHAAARLGLSRRGLQLKMKELDLR
jgi:two-component system response regulator AtoC